MAVRVVDTNVFSFLLRGNLWARRYVRHLAGHTLAVSFMTVAEIYEWGVTRAWGQGRWSALQKLLSGYVVVESDDNVCRRWAQVRFDRRPQPIAVDDAWIAATALVYSAELVTHNPGDFQGIPGLSIITEVP